MRAASCTRAARRLGWRGLRAPRAPSCARARRCAAIGDGVVELADGSSERADQVLVATGAWTRGLLPARAIRSTQQVNVYLRVQSAGLPVWIYDPDVYGLADDGGAGLKVGGHAIGADVGSGRSRGARGPGR